MGTTRVFRLVAALTQTGVDGGAGASIWNGRIAVKLVRGNRDLHEGFVHFPVQCDDPVPQHRLCVSYSQELKSDWCDVVGGTPLRWSVDGRCKKCCNGKALSQVPTCEHGRCQMHALVCLVQRTVERSCRSIQRLVDVQAFYVFALHDY